MICTVHTESGFEHPRNQTLLDAISTWAKRSGHLAAEVQYTGVIPPIPVIIA
jgi:hypothetical protein